MIEHIELFESACGLAARVSGDGMPTAVFYLLAPIESDERDGSDDDGDGAEG